jgi:hypothetical protein
MRNVSRSDRVRSRGGSVHTATTHRGRGSGREQRDTADDPAVCVAAPALHPLFGCTHCDVAPTRK